jgi:prevent-host-death family protein
MRYDRIKPISYFKANAAEILKDIAEGGEPMIVTQNGEAKAIVQDIASYQKTQDTLALLKLIAMGKQEIEAGKTKPLRDVIDRLKNR